MYPKPSNSHRPLENLKKMLKLLLGKRPKYRMLSNHWGWGMFLVPHSPSPGHHHIRTPGQEVSVWDLEAGSWKVWSGLFWAANLGCRQKTGKRGWSVAPRDLPCFLSHQKPQVPSEHSARDWGELRES